jgi:hypothetical protein
MDDNDELLTLGREELDLAWLLLSKLAKLKESDKGRGRLWAIAATEAEKLFAWVGYVCGTAEDD